MRKIIGIIILLWNVSFAQSYVATWTGKPPFQVQRSTDKKTWKTVYTTNNASYSTMYGANYYWRIKTLDTYTNIVWVYSTPTVTSAKLNLSGEDAIVSWRSTTETNVSYYTVESKNNSTTINKHSNGLYSITVDKIGVTYSIIAHYYNGDIQLLKQFN